MKYSTMRVSLKNKNRMEKLKKFKRQELNDILTVCLNIVEKLRREKRKNGKTKKQ